MKNVTVKTSGTAVTGQTYVGTTDVAIQQAVNYVNANGGGSIFIEKGTYTISTPIDLYSNIEISGEHDKTVLTSTFANGSSKAILNIVGTAVIPKENIYIHDLLLGSSGTSNIGWFGILAEHCGKSSTTGLETGFEKHDPTTVGPGIVNKTGIRIENCIIQRNRSFAISLISCSNSVVVENIIQTNNSYGISLNSCNNNIFTKNKIHNNNHFGVYLPGLNNDNTITNNVIQNNNRGGIQLLNSSHKNSLISNVIQNNNGPGVAVSDSINNMITGNTVQNNNGDGINLNSRSDNNSITGNTIQNNSGIGIVASSYNTTVIGNTVQNNGDNGILLQEYTYTNTVTGNVAKSNGGTGILSSESDNSIIAGNSADVITISGTGNISSPNIARP